MAHLCALAVCVDCGVQMSSSSSSAPAPAMEDPLDGEEMQQLQEQDYNVDELGSTKGSGLVRG